MMKTYYPTDLEILLFYFLNSSQLYNVMISNTSVEFYWIVS